MRIQPFLCNSRVALIGLCLPLLFACSVNVKKDANGNEKNVQIDTPVASLHVSKDATANDTGLPVYPGARQLEKVDGNDKSANVNIQTGFFGLKVVAVEYQTDESVEKVKNYYDDQLKKYGNLLECRAGTVAVNPGFGDDSKSEALTCEQTSGSNFELKAGTPHNQHVVSIQPNGKGCKFALVYIQMHGKEATI